MVAANDPVHASASAGAADDVCGDGPANDLTDALVDAFAYAVVHMPADAFEHWHGFVHAAEHVLVDAFVDWIDHDNSPVAAVNK